MDKEMELQLETAPGQGKKNPAIAVYNSSFELIRNRGDPLDCFRLPTKACRPQPQLQSLGFINYGSRTWFLITSIGRVNSFKSPVVSKELALFSLRL
jgi:hypothetical protein